MSDYYQDRTNVVMNQRLRTVLGLSKQSQEAEEEEDKPRSNLADIGMGAAGIAALGGLGYLAHRKGYFSKLSPPTLTSTGGQTDSPNNSIPQVTLPVLKAIARLSSDTALGTADGIMNPGQTISTARGLTNRLPGGKTIQAKMPTLLKNTVKGPGMLGKTLTPLARASIFSLLVDPIFSGLGAASIKRKGLTWDGKPITGSMKDDVIREVSEGANRSLLGIPSVLGGLTSGIK